MKLEVATFYKEARFIKDIILNDIPDSDHLYVPRGCEILQIVIQKEPEFEGAPRFVVSDDLWRLLDNDNKVALILHEIIYKIAIKNQQQDSKKTRYLNSLLFSGEILKLQGKEFASLVTNLGLKNGNFTYLHEGLELYVDEFSSGNMFFGGRLATPVKLRLLKNELIVDKVSFYFKEFGEGIHSVNLPCNLLQSFSYKNLVEANFCGAIELSSAGGISAIQTVNQESSYATVMVNQQKVEVSYASFDSNELATYINAITTYEHLFHGNIVPLIGDIRFVNGELDLSPRTQLSIARDFTIKIGSIEFKVSERLDDHIWVNHRGLVSFGSAESFPVKIPHLPKFYCGGRIAFFENGNLESCINEGTDDYADFTRFNLRDGSSIKIKNYYLVHFDRDGFFSEVDPK